MNRRPGRDGAGGVQYGRPHPPSPRRGGSLRHPPSLTGAACVSPAIGDTVAFVVPSKPSNCAWWDPGVAQAFFVANGVYPDPNQTMPGQLRGLLRAVADKTQNEFAQGYVLIVDRDLYVWFPAIGTNEWWYECPVVEVPYLSGKYYFVFAVSDVATGFSNSYRQLHLVPTYPFEGAYGWSGYPHWPWAPAWPIPFPPPETS